MAKKLLKTVLIILGVILLCAAAFILWLSVTEFKPGDVSDVKIEANSEVSGLTPFLDEEFSVISWNIGYAGLGKGSDFFMDGGENVSSADQDTVNASLLGIYKTLYSDSEPATVFMLQEVDQNSTRTYGKNEVEALGINNSAYALNYSCKFVPYPIPPIGRVNSGLLTTTVYDIGSAERISLPCPFDWPVSMANLKRCLLVSYLPISGTDSKLVIVNLHLRGLRRRRGQDSTDKAAA